MKNSFSKAYETKTLEDGSVEIAFKSQRFGFAGTSAILFLSLLIGTPAGCMGVMSMRESNRTLGFIVMIVGFYIFLYFLFKSKTVITVKPNVGLTFSGKSLPFSDIKSLGVVTETGKNGKTIAYVEAQSLGNSVRVSDYIKPELASAVAEEIRSASGRTWA